jgi:PPOX class probable F420-dependent enzyme
VKELDPATEHGARALDRLEKESTGWLTTINPDGQPQASPVWFVWRDGEVLIYSHKRAPRNANIAAQPLVAFNLNTDARGDDVVTMEGVARIDLTIRPSSADPDFQAKYRQPIADNGWTPEWLSGEYPVPIVVRPTRWRLL